MCNMRVEVLNISLFARILIPNEYILLSEMLRVLSVTSDVYLFIRKNSPVISGKVYCLKGKKETRLRRSSDG